jgi:hypothetical protein
MKTLKKLGYMITSKKLIQKNPKRINIFTNNKNKKLEKHLEQEPIFSERNSNKKDL